MNNYIIEKSIAVFCAILPRSYKKIYIIAGVVLCIVAAAGYFLVPYAKRMSAA